MFSDEARELSREAIRKRYQFLPLWYTLFYEHEMSGAPVMRPMLSQYPRDRNVLTLETQYMLGDKLLVCPVLDRSTTWVIVYFPSTDGIKAGDIWYDIDTYQRYDEVGTVGIQASIDKIPVFQRGGTIIPKKMTVRKSSFYMRADPFSLFVAVDKNNRAEGTLYYDDETSYDYQHINLFDYLHFDYNNGTLTVHPRTENYKQVTFERIYFAGVDETPNDVLFICGEKKTHVDTKTDSSMTGNAFYVDIQGIECDYNWSIELHEHEHDGSMKNVLGGALVMVIGWIHFMRYFL